MAIHNSPGRPFSLYGYTDYTTPFHQHVHSVLWFFFSNELAPTHFLQSMSGSNNVFSLILFINFLCWGRFFFGQSSKHLSADCLRSKHRCFYMVTSVGWLLPSDLFCTYTQMSFLVRPSAWLARLKFTKLGNHSFAYHHLACKPP